VRRVSWSDLCARGTGGGRLGALGSERARRTCFSSRREDAARALAKSCAKSSPCGALFLPSPPSRRMEKVPPRAPFANANVVRQALSRSNLALAARFEKSGALTRRLRDADFVLDTSALLRRCMDVLRIVFRISLVSLPSICVTVGSVTITASGFQLRILTQRKRKKARRSSPPPSRSLPVPRLGRPPAPRAAMLAPPRRGDDDDCDDCDWNTLALNNVKDF
jgi:hypothetical protein